MRKYNDDYVPPDLLRYGVGVYRDFDLISSVFCHPKTEMKSQKSMHEV